MDFIPQWDVLDVGAHVNMVLLPVMMDSPQGHLFRMLGTKQYVYLQGQVTIRGTGTFLRLVLLAKGIIPVLGVQQCTKQYEQHASSYTTVFQCLDLCAGAGFMSMGAKAVGYHDIGGIEQNPEFQALYEQIHDGPFLHFNIGDLGAVEYCLDKGMMGTTILSGINCQPYSRAGDQRGSADPRAMSLPYTLRFALYLQSPCVCLECTPAAAQDPQVQQLIRDFCQMVGFVPTQSILHLDRCWAARRDRWWCVLMPAILGPWNLPDLPIIPESQQIRQIMPYVKEWPTNEAQELALTLYEHLKFLEFSGPLDNLMMDVTKSMPTALHAWGNQLYKCQCGCRQAFSDHRLRTKGLHAMLIPTGSNFQHEGNEYPACRHPHPNEVLLLCGMYPNLDFHGKMRLGLAAAGQLASPIQSAWVLGHVKQHIEAFLQVPSQQDPHQLLASFQRSLLRARDISWPVQKTPSEAPSQGENQSCHEIQSITISAFSPGGIVSHAIFIAAGVSVSQLRQAESEVQKVHAQSLSFVASGQTQPLAPDYRFVGGECLHMHYSEIDDTFLGEPRQLWPMDEGGVEQVHEHDDLMQDAVPPPRAVGPLELPLDLAVPPASAAVVPATVESSVSTDPLCRLPASALLTLVAPQVASQSTLESLRSQSIPAGDRKQVLHTQGDLWADDELCFHLQKTVRLAPADQHVISWDPLAITSLWTSQHEQLIYQWGQALPEVATIITAVWIKAHWVPFVWRKDNQKIFGYTYGNPQEHEVSLQQFHAKVGALCKCEIGPLHNEKALVNQYCGAVCMAYFQHLIDGRAMPTGEQIPSCHQAFRQEFVEGLSNETSRPWIWGRGSDEVDVSLQTLLRQHGVSPEEVKDRAEHIKTTLGTFKVGQAMSSNNPWKDLKWLANQQLPPYQIIRPIELEKAIASRGRDGAPVGNKRLKQKGSGKGKKGIQVKQQLEPASLRITEGTFVAGDTAVSQIGIGDIGPLASGIVLATADQALPFLGKNHPISMGGLAIVVIGEIEIGENVQQLPTLVRFPAICIANSEPILVDGKVFQLGNVEIQRPTPKQAVDLTTIDTFVAKVCVHRDLFQGDWVIFGTQPMKYIISQLPFLQVCTDTGCSGCAKWHSTEKARDPILAVWNRQWLSNAYTPDKPEAADMYVVTIRVPIDLEMSLLQVSGATSICVEPPELDGRMISKSYHVTWLPKLNYAQAMALRQTTPGAIGLARLGVKWGLRSKIGDAARVYQAIKPDSSFLPSGQKQLYLMGPLPYGTIKQSVVDLCKQMNWPCRPLQPAPAARAVDGIMWRIQATSHPPKHHLQLTSGDVVITRIDTPKVDQQQGPAAIGSSTTLKLCSHLDTPKVDPLQVNDPWAKSAGSRGLDGSHPSAASTVVTAALEQQVVAQVLAKLPKPSMETDIPEQHHDRISTLEAQVQKLADQQQGIHQTIQDQGLAQQAQFSQLQHQFQAQHSQLEHVVADQQKQVQGLTSQFQQQLDKQKTQIDHMFSQQMSRMEDLLGAKKQRFE